MEKALQPGDIGFGQIQEAVIVLSSAGALLAAQDDSATQKAIKRTERLNTHLMTKARSSNELNYLACPVTGGGVTVPRFQQLFLLAREQGHNQPQDWAHFVWTVLAAQGQRLVKEGKALDAAEDNLAELTRQATEFAEKRLPLLKALHIG